MLFLLRATVLAVVMAAWAAAAYADTQDQGHAAPEGVVRDDQRAEPWAPPGMGVGMTQSPQQKGQSGPIPTVRDDRAIGP